MNEETVRCPTCGAECRVASGAEGTNSYRPVADEEIRRLRMLVAWACEHLRIGEAPAALGVTWPEWDQMVNDAIAAGVREARGG